jgi:hypothetical protein
MKGLSKRKYKKKTLFKAKDYCINCQQQRSCGLLDEEKQYLFLKNMRKEVIGKNIYG